MTIKCIYFKSSGKYYSEGEADYDASLFTGCIYPREYGQRLREMKTLPGLHEGSVWSEGYFVVWPADSYPELMRPLI